ncbi:MAG TPA: VOC family protein [Acidisarcina sp.]
MVDNTVSAIPDGYHSITPYLIVDGAVAAIEYYKAVFGATEVLRMPEAGGRIMHAEIQIGTSRLMLADEHPKMGAYAPAHFNGTPLHLMLYVEDVDGVFAKAVAEGAKVERPLADQFYGDRTGGIIDPFGHHWYLATHIRDVSMEEMQAAGVQG